MYDEYGLVSSVCHLYKFKVELGIEKDYICRAFHIPFHTQDPFKGIHNASLIVLINISRLHEKKCQNNMILSLFKSPT